MKSSGKKALKPIVRKPGFVPDTVNVPTVCIASLKDKAIETAQSDH
jgi:hypothetical protein